MIDESIILFSYNSKSSRNSRAEIPPPSFLLILYQPLLLIFSCSSSSHSLLLPKPSSLSTFQFLHSSTPHLRWYSPSLLSSFQFSPPTSFLSSFLSYSSTLLLLLIYFSSPFSLFLLFLPTLSFSPPSFCLLTPFTRTLTPFLFLSPNSGTLSLDLLFWSSPPNLLTLSPPYPTPYPWVMTGMMKGFSSPFLPTIPLGGKYIV